MTFDLKLNSTAQEIHRKAANVRKEYVDLPYVCCRSVHAHKPCWFLPLLQAWRAWRA